jgi:hypothetical protein
MGSNIDAAGLLPFVTGLADDHRVLNGAQSCSLGSNT